MFRQAPSKEVDAAFTPVQKVAHAMQFLIPVQ